MWMENLILEKNRQTISEFHFSNIVKIQCSQPVFKGIKRVPTPETIIQTATWLEKKEKGGVYLCRYPCSIVSSMLALRSGLLYRTHWKLYRNSLAVHGFGCNIFSLCCRVRRVDEVDDKVIMRSVFVALVICCVRLLQAAAVLGRHTQNRARQGWCHLLSYMSIHVFSRLQLSLLTSPSPFITNAVRFLGIFDNRFHHPWYFPYSM